MNLGLQATYDISIQQNTMQLRLYLWLDIYTRLHEYIEIYLAQRCMGGPGSLYPHQIKSININDKSPANLTGQKPNKNNLQHKSQEGLMP